VTPREHQRAKRLFQQAEELPPEERETLLAAEGASDERVVAEVRRLLRAARDTPETFLCGEPARATRTAVTAGRRLGPYEFLAPLGAGAMGEVWRARDRRLGRDVAIKLLHPSLDRDPERRARFHLEARAVAALSHPNILALYDVGRSGGMTYAVTELLEGETLRQRLSRGPLPAGEATACARHIAGALSAAHGKGIVHRDLKPENVFLTANGHVKLVDFGIAGWREADGSRRRRSPGQGRTRREPRVLVGTPGYMAPEQARGRPGDRRVDLFALGCVLYEMLTGRRAFARDTSAETLRAVCRDEPPPPGPGADVPPALERILLRCLAKRPADRFQSAGDVVRELDASLESARPARREAATEEPPVPSRLLLAVLPFASIGDDAEQRFADGMTEEMIAVLGRAAPRRLGVIARTSAMRFKKRRAAVDAIGRELGVSHVVEGSVRREGGRLRIGARLVRVADQAQIWSDSFDGPLSDILGLQADVARRVAGALSVELAPWFRVGRPGSATDAAAYDAYLAGRSSFYKASEEGWRAAIDHYKEAVALDAGFALAHAGIASGYTAWALWGTTPPGDARASAAAAIARAAALEPDLAEVHATLALIRMFFEWDWTEADREFARAIALNPSDGEVYHWLAHYLLFVGRPQEALDAFAEARRIDPLSAFHRECQAGHYVAMGELERAEPLLRGVLEQLPSSPLAHHFLGWLEERRGRIAEAVSCWEAAARASHIPNLLASVGYGYALAGRREEALQVNEELERRAGRAYVAALDRAKVFAGLGEPDEAFAWLEEAYRRRDAWLPALKIEPGFDTLRGDQRFPALLRRIGVTP
jgi:serine/threonine protein kinase/tetratricopeptide (TPR) repeat protein